ncbi:MAG: diaminopimelate decarboxylase [Halobacteriovorax sp.]|nr:diaminopimelate decarboxylase [Halobacteriovorax sp.]|tara:strand:+ start:101597 stop:102841 length:1245 start_codon:yes stop_codon:yes gene_type:complete
MEKINSSPLCYKKGKLHFDNIPLETIAGKVKTPFYLYSEKTLLQNYNHFLESANKAMICEPLICFALKANPNLKLLKSLAKNGAGADIVSGGELKRALDAGIKASKIVFSGVGKTKEEIIKGIKAGIYSFNVESIEELEQINLEAKKLKKRARVAFRLNPKVHAKTHKHISTGFKTHKFGILKSDILKAVKNKKYWTHTDLVGLSMHIGSQLTCLKATKKAVKELGLLANEVNRPLEFLDVGGGLGVDYGPEEKKNFSTPYEYMSLISKELQSSFYKNYAFDNQTRIVFEPGRVIAARAGAFITKVIRTKKSEDCFFAIVDGGMNDFVRTSLYGAYHEILTEKKGAGKKVKTDIVGPICETADCFGTGRSLPRLNPGDLISVGDVGAYGFSMASHYNMRELPKEIIVSSKGKLS